MLFAEKNFYCGTYSDGKKLEEILNFRSKDIDLYYEVISVYKHSIFRIIPRLLAKPIIWKLKLGRKKK